MDVLQVRESSNPDLAFSAALIKRFVGYLAKVAGFIPRPPVSPTFNPDHYYVHKVKHV